MRVVLGLIAIVALVLPAAAADADVQAVLDGADLPALETVIVARDGEVAAERAYGDADLEAPTNIKSASKSIVATLVGIAIDRGVITGVDQPVSEILKDDLPADADPRLQTLTVGNLLSMQAGLEPTSGPNYGSWVASRNWVRFALARPFETDPGGPMQYSTGSSHLLSAILTKATGRSTMALAREWLDDVDDFSIAGWAQDPQGIYLGGNEMAMSPRSLLAFGEMVRNGGRSDAGAQVVSEDWIAQSWEPRTRSRFSGDGYGYGWFQRSIGGAEVHFGWGYGGQMLYIVPELALTVVMTSDASEPSARTGHRDALHALLAEIIATVRPDEG